MRSSPAGAVLVLATWGWGGAAHAQPTATFVAPQPGAAQVIWSRPGQPLPAPRPLAPLVARLNASRGAADSLAAWQTVARDSVLHQYALLRIARLELARADTARAEAAWSLLAHERSAWQWEALRARTEILVARGLMARADSLLERAVRDDWSDAERGGWLARRVDLELALGDSTRAMSLAAQMIARYPSDPGAPAVLRSLEATRAARGDSLTAGEQTSAAWVDLAHGQKAEAAARLARAARRGADTGLHLRRARLLRELKRFREAREATAGALRSSESAEESLAVRIERARILRGAGDIPGALRAFADAARRAPGGAPDARWERARLLEEQGEWRAARNDYARVAELRAMGDEGSMFRAGLMSLAAGEPRTARTWFARGKDEGARFWHGVVLRRLRSRGGDSLLRELAGAAGYTFYRAAARETLALAGWPGWSARRAPSAADPGLKLARTLDAIGCHDDAAGILERWAAGDRRLVRVAGANGPDADTWLAAAEAGYRAGRPRQGIRFAARGTTRLDRAADSLAWSVSPWLYPPSFESLFAVYPESTGAAGIERALLRAVAWKESRFDPLARSRSDAIGLLQLKRPAVVDVARWLKETPPSDSALTDPALNLRYGSRYLERMLVRFGGDLPLSLAAYNAGPAIATRWTRLRAIGGDALACEGIDYPETQDYVKTILAVRQACRELRPAFAP